MAKVKWKVSYRQGCQIMVKGLSLVGLGYRRGALVLVKDVTAGSGNQPWCFIVDNDETATLSCRSPSPPDWIKADTEVEIEILGKHEEGGGRASDVARQESAKAELIETKHGEGESNPAIWAVDVGAPQGGFAWARMVVGETGRPCGGTNVAALIDGILEDLRDNRAVALGFEAPTFLGVPPDFLAITGPRTGEVAHGQSCSWFAPIGVRVMALGLPTALWILRALRDGHPDRIDVIVDFDVWQLHQNCDRGPSLFLWEALVFGPAHARGDNEFGASKDVQDAATAVLEFSRWAAANPRRPSDVTADPCFSLVGSAAVWAGLTMNAELMRRAPVVLRPDTPLGAHVGLCSKTPG